MNANLYIKSDSSFDAALQAIFALINVRVTEERFSDNTAAGHYVYGEALGLRVRFEEADDSDFPDYQYLLSLRAMPGLTCQDRHALDSLADLVAQHLSRNGMHVSRPVAFGRIGTERIDYPGRPK